MRMAVRVAGIAVAVFGLGMAAGCSDDSPTGTGNDSIATIDVAPSSFTLTSLTETHQLTATAKTASGATVSNVQFTWASSDDAVATVSSSGLVTAVAPGQVTISAAVQDVSGSTAITVDQLPAQVVFQVEPSDAESGAVIAPAVEIAVQDALGNLVAAATNAVTVALEPGESGTLSGTTTVNAVNGVATFDDLMVSGVNAGYTLVASAEDLTGATSAAFNIAAATLTPLEAQALADVVVNAMSAGLDNGLSASSAGSGASDPDVSVSLDLVWPCEEGNIAINGSASGTLDLQTGDGSASVDAAANMNACKVTSTVFGSNVTLSDDPDIDPDVALSGSLGFDSFRPTTLTGDMEGAVLWEAEDGRSGRCVIDVELEWTPDGGKTLSGTVCDEDISLGRTPTQLAFIAQPNSAAIGGNIETAVAIQDASGFTVLDATGEVTVGIGSNPGGGSLSGTTSVNAVFGIAVFTGLSIDQAGTGYTLTASSSGLTGADSESFNVTGTSGGGSISTSEARELADIVASGALAALNGEFNGSGGSSAIDKDFSYTWTCESGVIETTGHFEGDLDLQTGDGSASVDATSTPKSCKVTSSIFGMDVTIDGAPNVRLVGDLELGSYAVAYLDADMDGTLAWEAEDDRSGVCDLDVRLVWTPSGGKSLSGTVCDKNIGSSSSSNLSAAEARELAEIVAAATLAAVDNEYNSGGGSGSASASSGNIDKDLSYTWDCESGEIETSGHIDGNLDLQSGAGSASVDATATPKSCKVTSSVFGMDVTIDGAPNVELVGQLQFGSFNVTDLTGDMDGKLAWKAEDGRSGLCEIDAHLEWTPEGGSSLSGTACDEDLGDL